MEKYIQDLCLSQSVKLALKRIGIIKTSDLNGYDYKTLASKCSGIYNTKDILNELNSLGYILPPENEISVYDIDMSKRLQNVLIRNKVLYLSQLTMYPREKILRFRNLAKTTMLELENICKEHAIQILSLSIIKEAFMEYSFPAALYERFFQNGIFCIDDFKQKSAHDLYIICGCDYELTMRTYYKLQKTGVKFEDWQDKYIFELMPKQKTIMIWKNYNIKALSQLSDCNETRLKDIILKYPSLLETVNVLH